MLDYGSAPLRVLVIDDSAVARQIVAKVLARNRDLVLAGVAENGKVGLGRIQELQPDAIVLDLDMPVMGGLSVLAELRAQHSSIPVIVFSATGTRQARAALDALALGASAFVMKPTANSRDTLESELVPLLRALGSRGQSPIVARQRTGLAPRIIPASIAPVRAIVIACSTGGPTALTSLLVSLPGTLSVPILVVQHMPQPFTRLLAERLNGLCALTVTEGSHGDVVQPGHVYIAPGGRHMSVAPAGSGAILALDDGPLVNSCRPAANVLFMSAVRVYASGVLAVVLTGMGRDGLDGTREIVASGGSAIVQDQASSVVGSMPGAVADAGLASAVGTVEHLAVVLRARVRGNWRRP